MRKGVVEIAVTVSLLVAAAGCSDDACTSRSASYTLQGTAPSSASCSSMVLVFYEGSSAVCESGNTASASTPGNEVLEHAVTPAASFKIVVPVHYTSSSSPPSLDVQLFCDENGNGKADPADTCLASRELPAGDHSDVALTPGSSCARL